MEWTGRRRDLCKSSSGHRSAGFITNRLLHHRGERGFIFTHFIFFYRTQDIITVFIKFQSDTLVTFGLKCDYKDQTGSDCVFTISLFSKIILHHTFMDGQNKRNCLQQAFLQPLSVCQFVPELSTSRLLLCFTTADGAEIRLQAWRVQLIIS